MTNDGSMPVTQNLESTLEHPPNGLWLMTGVAYGVLIGLAFSVPDNISVLILFPIVAGFAVLGFGLLPWFRPWFLAESR